MMNCSQLSTIGCFITVAFSCWLMNVGSVGHRCDCHMILEVGGCLSLGLGICRVSLSHGIAGCRVSVIGLWAQSGIAVIVT
jgi:hypothetical protein